MPCYSHMKVLEPRNPRYSGDTAFDFHAKKTDNLYKIASTATILG